MNYRQLCIVVLLVILTKLGCTLDRQPSHLETVIRNRPLNVKFEKIEKARIFDCCIWIKFKYLSSDSIMISPYFTDYTQDNDQWDALLPPEVDWWIKPKMKDEFVYYDRFNINDPTVAGLYLNRGTRTGYYVEYIK